MRKFKFRVWSDKLKKFDYSNLLISLDGKLFTASRENQFTNDVSIFNIGSLKEYVGDCFIQQFTGLKDIKGKEIYEGDIVKLDNSPYVYKMIWGDWRWGLESPDLDHIVSYTGAVQDRCEVIGNIFENPELLNS